MRSPKHRQVLLSACLHSFMLNGPPCASQVYLVLVGQHLVCQNCQRQNCQLYAYVPSQVYLVLFGLYRARPLAQFWSMVASRTLARNLFIKYCRAKVGGCTGVRHGII